MARIFVEISQVQPGLSLDRESVVTIGTFDGMHQGHRAVVASVVKAASERNYRAVAVTFDPRPEVVLRPATALPNIVTLQERIDALREHGIEEVVVIHFTSALAKLSASEFLEQLYRLVRMRTLCVGDDFTFGHGARCDVAGIRALGIETIGVSLVPGAGHPNEKASSTNMRRALAAGVRRSVLHEHA